MQYLSDSGIVSSEDSVVNFNSITAVCPDSAISCNVHRPEAANYHISFI